MVKERVDYPNHSRVRERLLKVGGRRQFSPTDGRGVFLP
jgi:hypothetical protein